jgi:hypothetical protein
MKNLFAEGMGVDTLHSPVGLRVPKLGMKPQLSRLNQNKPWVKSTVNLDSDKDQSASARGINIVNKAYHTAYALNSYQKQVFSKEDQFYKVERRHF